MDSIYDNLLELPLFKGVSHERMVDAVGTTPFHFLKFLPGQVIIDEGDACSHIVFIISGKVRVSISARSGRFAVSQTLEAPDVVAPEYLFGRTTSFPCRVTAIDSVGILQIEKNDYLRILNSDKVFMYNFLNLLSMKAQKGIDGILALTNGSLEERLAYWIVALTQSTGVDIEMTCKTRDLYSMFGVQRSSFIAMLDTLVKRGIITYEPGIIRVTERSRLLQLLQTGL